MSIQTLPQGYILRSIKNGDEEGIAEVISEAWIDLGSQTGTYSTLESLDVTRSLVTLFTHNSTCYPAWVITCEDEIVGVTFLSRFSDKVNGAEIIAVSPFHQGKSLGRILTNTLIQHSKASSIRLTQDSFNTTSFSLYLDCGFDAVDYLCCIKSPDNISSNSAMKGSTVTLNNNTSLMLRPMTEDDLDIVDALFQECNDCSRKEEIRDVLDLLKHKIISGIPYVLFDGSTLLAFTTGFDLGGYSVARSEEAMKMLIDNYQLVDEAFVCCVPCLRYSWLARWLLHDKKFQVHKNMTLMSRGWYSPPKHIYLPNVVW